MTKKIKWPQAESLRSFAVLVAVLLTLFSAISAGMSAQSVKDDQVIRDAEQACTTETLFSAIVALNERTTYSTEQAMANIALQQAQAKFLRTLLREDTAPAPSTSQSMDDLEDYFGALQTYNSLVTRSTEKALTYSYPTEESYVACLDRARPDR